MRSRAGVFEAILQQLCKNKKEIGLTGEGRAFQTVRSAKIFKKKAACLRGAEHNKTCLGRKREGEKRHRIPQTDYGVGTSLGRPADRKFSKVVKVKPKTAPLPAILPPRQACQKTKNKQ